MFRYLAFISFLLIAVEGDKNWHTSQIVLNELYDIQKEHFSAINDYLDLETKRLDKLKK